ncbi:ABC transporter substrate-binding protein [Methanocalculus taiwanensis]|uniref:ABC transporter substrate-binding protein n=1 Tax=Methanocalculus taiwanensis TaxID=106207 RepID=A0ABD4TJH3_9EURY|nr:ABC transporter substrate-binding protein [Methanocalculus taiwanensis]MCQ1539074.1 ABC transporter substrate-binding protein [Methanocalculus taiwanensis]
MKGFGALTLILLLIAPVSSLGAASDDSHQLLAEGILATLKGDGPGIDLLRDAAALYPSYPRSITDSAGVEIVLYRPPDRIIAMNSNAADVLSVIGLGTQVIGVGDTVVKTPLQFPDLALRTNIGKYNEPDIETILALRPDLLISYVLWPDAEKLDRHLPKRITVIRMDLYKAETFRDEFSRLSYITGDSEKAAAYLEWYDKIHTLVQERVMTIPEEERTRVFVDYGAGKSTGRRTMSEGTGLHDIIVTAGGINIAGDRVTGYADVENEWVIAQKPDVILIWSPKGGYVLGEEEYFHEAWDDVIKMPGFNRIPAIRDERIYVISSAYGFGTSSPASLVKVASWLYPDLFADIDPDAIHSEYLDRFTHTGKEIKEEGTFYYPKR